MTPVLTDEVISAKWLEFAEILDVLNRRTASDDDFTIGSGSSLAGDEKACHPYGIAFALRHSLNAGVDQLHAVKSLVVDRAVLHTAAPYALARGALEAFATAYWILHPRTRNARIERNLRWHAQNASDSVEATGGLNLPNAKTIEERRAAIYAVADARSIKRDIVGVGYRTTTVITYAEQNEPDLPLGVLLPWRLCSGFAHGRPWASLALLDRDEVPIDIPGMRGVKLTSDLGRTLYAPLAALQFLERFLKLYEQRAKVHLA